MCLCTTCYTTEKVKCITSSNLHLRLIHNQATVGSLLCVGCCNVKLSKRTLQLHRLSARTFNLGYRMTRKESIILLLVSQERILLAVIISHQLRLKVHFVRRTICLRPKNHVIRFTVHQINLNSCRQATCWKYYRLSVLTTELWQIIAIGIIHTPREVACSHTIT